MAPLTYITAGRRSASRLQSPDNVQLPMNEKDKTIQKIYLQFYLYYSIIITEEIKVQYI
jgi:hypothetical protein